MGTSYDPGLTGAPDIVSEVPAGEAAKPDGSAPRSFQVPGRPVRPVRVDEFTTPEPATPTSNSRAGFTVSTGVGGATVMVAVSGCEVNAPLP